MTTGVTSGSPPPPPAIAVIVATHHRPGAIATLMHALARQTVPKYTYEVVVVVDGRDELEDAYRRELDDARDRLGIPLAYMFQDNAGPAQARHRAICATSARWLCITDDDMELAPGCLEAHLAVLKTGGERTVVIGHVIPEEGWQRQPLYEATAAHNMLTLHDGLRRGARRVQGPGLVTQNVSLARSAYDRVGGFDPALRLAEDTDLGWRLERDGAQFVFAPDAWAIHHSRVGSYETWLGRQFQYGRNAVYIHRKLDRDLRSHPLRNLLNGDPLKRAVVRMTCWSDRLARAAIAVLRWVGDRLQRRGLIGPALTSYKGIMAIAYHLGVKEVLGSWKAFNAEGRAFLAAADRPLDPT